MSRVHIALLLFALAGSAFKAWTSGSQATWSRRSLGDIVIGAAVGFIGPAFLPSVMMSGTAIEFQCGAVFVLAYFSSHVINALLAKFGIAPALLNPAPLRPPPTVPPPVEPPAPTNGR